MVIVLDTSVFVSALLSPDGASREVLRRCLLKHHQPLFGAALLAEYEDLLARRKLFAQCPITEEERQELFEALISVSGWKNIFYGWRPNLRDEADNHLIELAVAGSAEAIITHNIRDFTGMELQFPDLKIITPAQLIQRSS
jgi:uncharacterized protein